MPIGEYFDLERVAEYCREQGRRSFFLSSVPLKVSSTSPFPFPPSPFYQGFGLERNDGNGDADFGVGSWWCCESA
jgi:hypothetical protein